MRCTRLSHSNEFDYRLNNNIMILKSAHQHQYLGVTLDESMQWSHHIQALCKKANKTFRLYMEKLATRVLKQVLTYLL